MGGNMIRKSIRNAEKDKQLTKDYLGIIGRDTHILIETTKLGLLGIRKQGGETVIHIGSVVD